MKLDCPGCDSPTEHGERYIGSIATLEERRELVCLRCGHVAVSTPTRAPVVWIHFELELPCRVT